MSKVLALKGSVLSVSVLRLFTDEFELIKQELDTKIAQAPDFFSGLTVVIEPVMDQMKPTFLALLVEYFHQKRMVLIGVRTDVAEIMEQVTYAGLAVLEPLRRGGAEHDVPADEDILSTTVLPEASQTISGALFVEGAVRSGQQIYAQGRDLIIRGSVNPGAEVVADGHIHIYGVLKGRAFAGSSGNDKARIYVKQLDAEMVCIAGLYQIADDIKAEFKRDWVEVSLDNQRLVFNRLG
ncbi:MAG: septum site-determining protein MinC [Thiomicrospira sp.]